MPYIKPPPQHPLTELLKGKNVLSPQLGKILGLCPHTAKQRLEDPSLLTIRDIRRIIRNGHIPSEEVRECVSKELSWTKF